jgi:hypothetical protein
MKRLVLASLTTAALACAQYAPAPTTYTVIQHNSLFGPAQTLQVDRDGSKAVMDSKHPGVNPGDKPTHIRSIFDLAAHTTTSWDAADPNAECGNGTFKGDWGDPFELSAGLLADLNKQKPTPAGTETVNGLPTKISEFTAEGSTAKAKVWIDSKYGLIMKLQLPQPSGPPQIAIETTQVTFAKPPASAFALGCKAPAPMPTDTDLLSAITGGAGADYAYANKGTPTGGGCLILFHVVRAGSMDIVPNGYELYVDGKQVPVTNGLARILSAPQQFNIEVRVPSGGATGPIYRQCSKPQTTLLLVAKNWDKLGEGADWVWVKSGKLAGH